MMENTQPSSLGRSGVPRGLTEKWGCLLRFRYTNHRGEDHEYLVRPARLTRPDAWWSLHAYVMERDGEPRPGERTFQIAGLREVEDVFVPYPRPEQPTVWIAEEADDA